jgi:hypothetical protein
LLEVSTIVKISIRRLERLTIQGMDAEKFSRYRDWKLQQLTQEPEFQKVLKSSGLIDRWMSQFISF